MVLGLSSDEIYVSNVEDHGAVTSGFRGNSDGLAGIETGNVIQRFAAFMLFLLTKKTK